MRFRVEKGRFLRQLVGYILPIFIAIADLESWRMGKGKGGWWTTHTR
jgi:hypothetical protein